MPDPARGLGNRQARVVASPAVAAISIGDQIQVTYLYPNIGTTYQNDIGTFDGTTLILPIINVFFGSANFNANLVTLTQTQLGTYNSVNFNGVRITNLTNHAAFSGWVELPGATGPTPHTTSFSNGSIFVNWQGAPVTNGMVIEIGAAVPEPQSWAFMIAGFGLIGTAARRRRTAVAA